MEVIEGNFRDFNEEYLSFICRVLPTTKQISPFIVVYPKQHIINGIFHLGSLLEEPDDSLIFHTWPGQWKSDVFYYRLGNVKRRIRSRLNQK